MAAGWRPRARPPMGRRVWLRCRKSAGNRRRSRLRQPADEAGITPLNHVGHTTAQPSGMVTSEKLTVTDPAIFGAVSGWAVQFWVLPHERALRIDELRS